nr:reverse transcriptase domain-containing protein [Tanacetum cinerariifolium]
MLERLVGNEFYYFLDGFLGYFQIPIDPQDQEKTTFTCPYGTFAYCRMPFGLCNAPGTFQRKRISPSGSYKELSIPIGIDSSLRKSLISSKKKSLSPNGVSVGEEDLTIGSLQDSLSESKNHKPK